MAQLGADVEQLDQLARKFDQEANTIEQIISQITSQVGGTWWEGNDANNFRNEWNSTYTSQLRNVCQGLQNVAGQVRTQAAAQRQTSQA